MCAVCPSPLKVITSPNQVPLEVALDRSSRNYSGITVNLEHPKTPLKPPPQPTTCGFSGLHKQLLNSHMLLQYCMRYQAYKGVTDISAKKNKKENTCFINPLDVRRHEQKL